MVSIISLLIIINAWYIIGVSSNCLLCKANSETGDVLSNDNDLNNNQRRTDIQHDYRYNFLDFMIVENIIISILVTSCILSVFYCCCLKSKISNKSNKYKKVLEIDQNDISDVEVNQDEVENLKEEQV